MKYGIIKVKRAFLYEENGVDVVDEVFFGWSVMWEDEGEWIEVWTHYGYRGWMERNLIEEKRLTAMCHGQLYQQRMKKAFDKKVKPRVFREGDLVLKKVLSFAPDSRGKWTPNYEGPYVVKRAFSGGALILTTMDGEDFTRPVNSDAVKKYFA